jgi:DNA mismatch repair protein MutH
MEPNAVLEPVGKHGISQLASEVRQKLERVLQAFLQGKSFF